MFPRWVDSGETNKVALFVGLVAFAASAILVPGVRAIARRVNAVDHPGLGKVHSGATPYFGGVAIGLAAIIVPATMRGWQSDAAYILLAAAMVAVTGLVDDLRDISPYPRLAIEIAAAALAVHAGARVDLIPGWAGAIVSVVAIVIVTNSFNLLDNMDGCAGIVATATAGALLWAALLEGQVLVAALAAGIVGACLGFLLYNWHPASIFMGDAGSLFLGFLVAVAAMKLRAVNTTPFKSAVGVTLILALPLFDTTLVVISRTRNGRSILQGGKDHLSHRLHQRGLPIRWVASSLGAIAVVCASTGVLVMREVVTPIPALIAVAAAFAVALRPLLKMEVYTAGSSRQIAGRLGRTAAEAQGPISDS